MKRLPLLLLALLAIIALAALAWILLAPKKVTANPSPDARAQQIIHDLGLKPLPRESGYLGLIGVSAQTLPDHGHPLADQSQNYYMLTRERPINYLHWLAS